VETNSSLIEVSEYFSEFEFVISFVLSHPCLCADDLNAFFFENLLKRKYEQTVRGLIKKFSSTQ
jgi:hypothetical protein